MNGFSPLIMMIYFRGRFFYIGSSPLLCIRGHCYVPQLLDIWSTPIILLLIAQGFYSRLQWLKVKIDTGESLAQKIPETDMNRNRIYLTRGALSRDQDFSVWPCRKLVQDWITVTSIAAHNPRSFNVLYRHSSSYYIVLPVFKPTRAFYVSRVHKVLISVCDMSMTEERTTNDIDVTTTWRRVRRAIGRESLLWLYMGAPTT